MKEDIRGLREEYKTFWNYLTKNRQVRRLGLFTHLFSGACILLNPGISIWLILGLLAIPTAFWIGTINNWTGRWL